jgi:hypothetical protein
LSPAAETAGGRGLLRSLWLRGAAAALVLAAWGWFLRGQVAALRTYPWQIEPGAFAGAAVLGGIYFAGLALCWTLLLRTTGGAARRVPLAAGARIWLSTMLARYVPGNIWHIVGRLALAGRLGVGRGQVLASATVEQLLTLLGALAVFGLCLPFWRGGAGGAAWLLLIVPAGLAGLHPRVLGGALDLAAARLGRPELAWRYRYSELLAALAGYALANLAAGLALVAVLGGLGVRPLPLAPAIGGAALAWAVGYLSFLTPSGLGVREAALTALLAQHIPLPAAIVGGLVHRLALTLGELLAAGAALALGRVTSDK